MDNDERERRDWPDEDPGAGSSEPDETAAHDDPSRPMPMDETTPDGASSADALGQPAGGRDEPASGEGWRNPEQPDRVIEEPEEAHVEPSGGMAEPEGAGRRSADEPPVDAAPAEVESWPTEPPAAGSAPDDAWPTAAPERRYESAGWEGEQRPPQEVEAYPASGTETSEAPSAAQAAPAHAVPDAEGSTGESTQCPRCGTENRPGLSFCRSCGQRLVAAGASTTVERPGAPEGTMACPRCGTHNRAGVAFCQNCGANLRGTAEGYVPPAAAADEREAAAEPARQGAILGPVVLLIGLAGLVTAYLLPFLYGSGDSLFDRAWGAGGYGVAFWSGYPDVNATLADQAYFGLAGPVPILGLLLLALAVAGFMRATPGPVQTVGLVIALLWSVGLIVLFVLVELLANWGGDLVGVLRVLTPAGIIFFLSSLIVLIGSLTRFSRG